MRRSSILEQQPTNMNTFHYKTPYNTSNIISALCIQATFFFVFVSLIQNVFVARAISSFDYPGNETDHLALLAIKGGLDIPDGTLSTWNHSVHHCYWEGIKCGRKHNRVTVLNLRSRGLSGIISPFVGNLTFLITVNLYNNSLHGHIPNTLGNLFRLKRLFLKTNILTGKIPANLSSCINLEILDMDHNTFEGELPGGLSALLKLEYFQFYSSKLKGSLFDIIRNLTSLKVISVTYNSFTGTIPHNINRMHNLQWLDVGSNKLSGTLPSSLFNMSSLETLCLEENQFNGELPRDMGFSIPHLRWLSFAINNFSGLLPSLTNFTNLETIQFGDNSFTGRIAIDFGRFKNLENIFLSGNHLQGDISIINTLVNCTKLRVLQLGSNQLSGVLPNSIANLSITLLHFLIGYNSMVRGEIPIGISNLINLRQLEMCNMKLTLSIPRDIGNLQKLEYLNLNSNRLNGKIPDSWSNMSRLSTLDLGNNKLEGNIPQSIGKCQNLLILDLSNNELNGTLQNKLFTDSAKFVELDLSNNYLEGPLPSEITKQTRLIGLGLSKNKFTGVLPDGLRECTELQSLFMDDNSFHGGIPTSYTSLTSLQKIDLSRNNLSGPFPAFFSKITSINYLNLSHNDFQGRVPTNSVFSNASEVFLAGNNKLCGGIRELKLPKCNENENRKRKKITLSNALKVIVSVISSLVGLLAVVAGIYMACLRKKKTPLPPVSVMGETFMKVSYDMLLKGTSGFSADTILGSGSFGTVFKGILDGKVVAVKVLNSQHHAAIKSFVGECKALRNVRHRNLVGIITACSSIDFQRNDFRALVYEFMPNGSLEKWLNGTFGNLSLRQRLDIVIDVAHALNYLHNECETPIVHCDLKPSNILLDQDMVAHVGDFGLTRFLTQPRHPNQSSTLGIMGTIGYAPPEYGLGSGAATAGDIYSYGILLLELITGKSPTDSMFKEDYNLHMYAQAALPDQVLQIVDPTLEEDDLTDEADNTRAIQDALQRKLECLVSVISVGVLCCKHLPQDRLKIPEAISKLEAAKKNLKPSRHQKQA